jgi:hypothetical protein
VLSLPGLIIGALTPDVAYVSGEGKAELFSHGLLGSVVFCLPVGLLVFGAFYWLRPRMVKLLPPVYRRALMPACERPLGPLWVIPVSILLGVWTHIFWDSFTHNEGWFVQRLSFLQMPIMTRGSRTARVCHVLWYGFSVAGVAWLLVVFERWKQACAGHSAGGLGRGVRRDAALAVFFVLPLGLVHHFVRGKVGVLLILGLGAVLASAFMALTLRSPRPE